MQIPAILACCAANQIQNPILLMDNCSVHHNWWCASLLISYGIEPRFLAPYTPKSNPIEESFSKFKAWIRRHSEWMHSHGFTALDVINEAFGSITAADALSWFKHAGYAP